MRETGLNNNINFVCVSLSCVAGCFWLPIAATVAGYACMYVVVVDADLPLLSIHHTHTHTRLRETMKSRWTKTKRKTKMERLLQCI